MVKLYYGVMPFYLPLAERRQAMKLTGQSENPVGMLN